MIPYVIAWVLVLAILLCLLWLVYRIVSTEMPLTLRPGEVYGPDGKPRPFKWATDETDECIERFIDRVKEKS